MMCRHSSAGSAQRWRSSAGPSARGPPAAARARSGRRGRSAAARRSRKSERAAGHCSDAQPSRRSALEGRARATRARAAYRLRAAPHARAQAPGSMKRATRSQTSGVRSAKQPTGPARAAGAGVPPLGLALLASVVGQRDRARTEACASPSRPCRAQRAPLGRTRSGWASTATVHDHRPRRTWAGALGTGAPPSWPRALFGCSATASGAHAAAPGRCACTVIGSGGSGPGRPSCMQITACSPCCSPSGQLWRRQREQRPEGAQLGQRLGRAVSERPGWCQSCALLT